MGRQLSNSIKAVKQYEKAIDKVCKLFLDVYFPESERRPYREDDDVYTKIHVDEYSFPLTIVIKALCNGITKKELLEWHDYMKRYKTIISWCDFLLFQEHKKNNLLFRKF
jgi:hypothetical protein